VGVEELWLGLAAVAAFAVPPAGTTAIQFVAAGTSDGDVGPGNGDERAVPLLVAESGCALEDDLSHGSQRFGLGAAILS